MAQLLSALMNTLFAAGSVPLIFTIERFGRRKILMYSGATLTICLVIFVAMIGLPNRTDATQWTAVGAIFVYNFVFGYGWIGVPWLYGPEVRSQEVKTPLQEWLLTQCRLPLSSYDTLVLRLAPLESGSSPSSLCSRAALRSRTWAGRSGSGWRCLAS